MPGRPDCWTLLVQQLKYVTSISAVLWCCWQIDMASFLTLTDTDLKELGITTFGARRKMLLAIAGWSCCLWDYDTRICCVGSRVAQDFGSGKSEIRPFFPNPAPAKFLARFGRIWQTPVQLQCVPLITVQTNEADLSSDGFAILISFACSYSIVINYQAIKSKFGSLT